MDASFRESFSRNFGDTKVFQKIHQEKSERERVCVCDRKSVCVCKRERACVSVCVCVREGEERNNGYVEVDTSLTRWVKKGEGKSPSILLVSHVFSHRWQSSLCSRWFVPFAQIKPFDEEQIAVRKK